jgi:GNAT superfamily N-acetyltransferase
VNKTGDAEIRRAQAGDIPALARLSGELGYPSTVEQVRGRWRDIESDGNSAVFVAVVDGAVVGWVHVYRHRVLEADSRAEIGGLVTAPSVRRRGIGRTLMARAEEWAREHGLKSVGLRSNVVREEAHRFYANLGYVMTKTQATFRKQLA